MNNEYTERELQLLEHIATLTDAIEEAMTLLDEATQDQDFNDFVLVKWVRKRVLKVALDAVWEDEELERKTNAR